MPGVGDVLRVASAGREIAGGALSLAVRALRAPVELAAGILEGVVRGGEGEPAGTAEPPAPPESAVAPESPAAPFPRTRAGSSPDSAGRVPAPPIPAEAVPEASPAEMRRAGREAAEEDAELVAEVAEPGAEDGAGAEAGVEPPWDGYDRMTAAEITARLEDAGPALAGTVQLYEQMHKRRSSVLRTAGAALKSARGQSVKA